MPGNFHIEMRSKHHNINPPMANLSHVVNSLTFGPPIERKMERRMKLIPEEYFRVENTRPMDNHYYLVPKLHQAFHHYIKVSHMIEGGGQRTEACNSGDARAVSHWY